MTDLTPDRVHALADALGQPLSPDDLDEVTHRLNAVLHALAPLSELPLDSVELWHRLLEGSWGGGV